MEKNSLDTSVFSQIASKWLEETKVGLVQLRQRVAGINVPINFCVSHIYMVTALLKLSTKFPGRPGRDQLFFLASQEIPSK